MALPTTTEADATSPGEARRRSARRPWMRVAGIAAGLTALVAVLLALPGGQVVGDTTTNITITTVLPGLERGEPVIQPFVASGDRLSAVYVTFGTFFGTAQCDLTATILERTPGEEPGDGRRIASRDWACTDLADTGRFQVLSFPAVEDSEGVLYDVVVERTDAGDGQGAVIWAGEPKGDALPVLLDGEEVPELSAMVRGEYDPKPHQWDQMSRILDRLADYGPQWGAPVAFVGLVLLLLAMVAAMPLSMRSSRTLFVLVAGLAAVRGLVWSSAVPLLEAMDEPAHFAYVQFLAEEGEFPGHVDNHEIFSPRLHGAIDVLNVDSTTPGDRPDYSTGAEARAAEVIDDLSPQGGGGGPGSMYAPFYYIGAVPLYEAAGDDILDQIALARLWSVLLGMAAAVVLVVIGRQLFPRSRGAQVAFAVAGIFQPMAAHQLAIVNNDAWVILAGFGALAIGLELTRRARAPWLALLAGAIIGMALLGKPFGIACAVPVAVGWLVGKVRARERSIRVLATEVGAVVLGLAGTYGLWLLNAARLNLNTSEIPEQTATGQSLAGFIEDNFGGQLAGFRRIWGEQLWGDFGWVRIPLPQPVPLLLLVIEAALLIGLVVWVVPAVRDLRWRRAMRAASATSADPVPDLTSATEADLRAAPIPLDVRILMIGVTIAGVFLTLYAAGWFYYMSTGQNDLLQGRYALLAIPAFIAGPALVAERLSHGRIRPWAVNVLAAAGMVAANLLGLLVVLEAFYG